MRKFAGAGSFFDRPFAIADRRVFGRCQFTGVNSMRMWIVVFDLSVRGPVANGRRVLVLPVYARAR